MNKKIFLLAVIVIVASVGIGVVLGLRKPPTPALGTLETRLRSVQEIQTNIRGNHATAFTESGQDAIDRSCRQDTDCRLVHTTNSFQCCWEGACDPLDYSQEDWIAVNQAWYAEAHDALCPSDSAAEESCGPAPTCPTNVVNMNFATRCIDSQCRKVTN